MLKASNVRDSKGESGVGGGDTILEKMVSEDLTISFLLLL